MVARASGILLYLLGMCLGSNIHPFLFLIFFQNGKGSGGNFHEWSSRRATRAKPSTSNIIVSLTMEELKVHCEVPDNIGLRLMERADESTLGGEHNGVFFTREHLAAGLRFPVPAIVKQFLHFT